MKSLLFLSLALLSQSAYAADLPDCTMWSGPSELVMNLDGGDGIEAQGHGFKASVSPHWKKGDLFLVVIEKLDASGNTDRLIAQSMFSMSAVKFAAERGNRVEVLHYYNEGRGTEVLVQCK